MEELGGIELESAEELREGEEEEDKIEGEIDLNEYDDDEQND